MRKKVLFIINPHSGPGKHGKGHIPVLLERYLDKAIYTWEIVYTRFAGDATTISAENRESYDLIVAVGGDGTINEVAKPLVNSQATLGIIPSGSGNGLARHLKIPRDPVKAIELLNGQCATKIDTIRLGGEQVLLNVAGTGFDAHIARQFARSRKRGFFSYASIALNEIRKFKPAGCHLVIDGEEKIENTPFLVSIANSSQYGNNAYIAPGALITDGLMDICVIRQFPFWYYPVLTYRLFTRTLDRSKYYQCWQGKEVLINFAEPDNEKHIHIDGDHYVTGQELKLTIDPLSLTVACHADNG